MKKAKKSYWIIGAIFLIAIVALLFYAYYPKENATTNDNSEYPAIKDYSKSPHFLLTGDKIKDVEGIKSISNNKLTYEPDKQLKNGDFGLPISCSDTNIQMKITPLSSFSDEETGLFSNEVVVECGNTYWIVGFSGTGWFIYGSFEKK
jgi:hypothetical protein